MKTLPIVYPYSYVCQPGRWRFKLTSELWIKVPGMDFGNANFYDVKGTNWCQARGDMWGVRPNYSWDGSTMVPDFESTIAASCFHDSTGQFRHTRCLKEKLSWARWNAIFAEIIAAQGSPWIAKTYWLGLMLFNPSYQLIGRLFGARPSGYCKGYENK